MDFVFATFPWFLIRKLEMRRIEKIGLCVTMSLGMLWVQDRPIAPTSYYELTVGRVAIESAVRISWKDDGNDRDEFYNCKPTIPSAPPTHTRC